MTAASRKTVSDRLRLPAALGIAGLMVTGTTAMAWPVLKTAFVPITAPAVAPADPAAVSGFVEMTRTQISPAAPAPVELASFQFAPVELSPALAEPADVPAPRLAQMTSPLMSDVTAPEDETEEQMAQAQAQTPRPAPRPDRVLSDSENEPHPILPRTTPRNEAQVMPTMAQQPRAATSDMRDRLNKAWSSGAFR